MYPLFDAVFPPHCLNCTLALARGVICATCVANVQCHQTLLCGRCKNRLPLGKKICHPDFPYLLGAATSYRDDAVRSLIHGLKFQFVRGAAEPLAHFLLSYVRQLPCEIAPFSVVPIPLSKERERVRGFNQSYLIAKIFAQHLNLPLVTNILFRTRDTLPQSELKTAEERMENTKGCFSLAEPRTMRGAPVLLVDDVITSGATLLEAARTLKKGGAKRIIALVVARA